MLDLQIGLLFDFYGQFLTEKQRKVMHLYFENDYSLGEIAENLHVSRQAIHDMIKKAKKTLYECEERLGLAKKFTVREKAIKQIDLITQEILQQMEDEEVLEKLHEIKVIISNINIE